MSLELEIQQLLLEHEHTDRIADELVRRWSGGLVNEEDLSTIAAFLHHCGYYPTIIDLCLKNLTESKPIPWRFFSEALKVIVDDIDYATVDALHQEADTHGRLEELALSSTLDPLEPGLKTIREDFFKRKWRTYLQQKTQIDEQLQVLRTQRMLDQERNLLDRFALLFPNDSDVIDAKNDFKDRWAREIVQRNAETPKKEREFKIAEDPEVEKISEIVGKAALSTAEETPEFAYDLALTCAFFENYEAALNILAVIPSKTLAETWLNLELMLPARRFIDALEEISKAEEHFANNPEMTFAATYFRSQALYGAGQRGRAIDLMKSLVALRPNYRSASLILSEWTS